MTPFADKGTKAPRGVPFLRLQSPGWLQCQSRQYTFWYNRVGDTREETGLKA